MDVFDKTNYDYFLCKGSGMGAIPLLWVINVASGK